MDINSCIKKQNVTEATYKLQFNIVMVQNRFSFNLENKLWYTEFKN